MAKPDTYIKSKEAILNHLLSFPTISNKDWVSCYFGQHRPEKGDLVSLQSAPPSKWQISWYIRSERPEGWSEDRHLLQSIEDRQECWWHNVGFSIYKPTNFDGKIPARFRWSDRQYAFNSRWHRVCLHNDDYEIRPYDASFREGFSVTLATRKRWSIDENWKFERNFDDWRKVTIGMMEKLYADAKEAAK